ncbi:MAG: response regulator [Trueperaceae bacterium]
MIQSPRTVLVVDDDAAARRLYELTLAPQLPEFALVVVEHGAEALEVLAAKPVEVMVTDLHMPVMDGFELLARVRERHPNLGVIVLSSMDPERVATSAPRLGSYRRVAKPVSAADLAAQVRAAAEERVRGHIAAIPLAPLLQLLQLERSTCSLLLRSGARKGRLHFHTGELVNAYAFELDADGEIAARHLLAWERATVDFERSLHNHVRRIHTPLAELLIDVAREHDERQRDQAARPASAPIEAAEATQDLDAALGGLASALGALRPRGASGAGRCAPARTAAEDAAHRGFPVATAPTTHVQTLDARLVQLAKHLAERAHVLGDELGADLPPIPTWGEARRG